MRGGELSRLGNGRGFEWEEEKEKVENKETWPYVHVLRLCRELWSVPPGEKRGTF